MRTITSSAEGTMKTYWPPPPDTFYMAGGSTNSPMLLSQICAP